MDKTTWLGIIIGIIAIGVGMFLKGVSFMVLINPAAILIIFLGTASSVLVAFPMSEVKRAPKIIGILFKEKQSVAYEEIMTTFVELSQHSRKEGLLAIEDKLDEIEDPFLKSGLLLAIDGQNTDYVRDILIEEIEEMEDRHQLGAAIFTQAGTYAPTLGVLGAVVGLIAALGNIEDTNGLGLAISAAFVATLMGIFTGYMLWHPFANKLKRKSKQEAKVKYMMVEGIISIVEGESPLIIQQKLSAFLTAQERKRYSEKEEVSNRE
ncbi:flagellar motor stator protein MotA [Metabacillus iocasae]|uniref:Chemotaxis protein MotA n=1 Tax=Priestia iocasae TaxID=2291674 RepID=A0ABS2QWL0_9BACI|nr:flagellar motor stator protein MotA [Metabacillus iocasae]MBM7703858.1 chemotaxis protein MotA [Metabacillus iocasae]